MIVPSFRNPGVNYAVAGADWAADAELFKTGRKFLRSQFPINIVCNNDLVPIPYAGIGTSNHNGNFADAHDAAVFFASDPVFDVIFNLYYGPTTRDGWKEASVAMVKYATDLQAYGLPIEISLGNEISGTYGLNFAIASLTQTDGVATLVLVSRFKTHVGDTFKIYGSRRPQYNATHTVLSWDGNKTVTFAIDPATINPGNGTCISMEFSEWWTAALATARAVKAVYTAGKVSVGEFDGIVNGVHAYAHIAKVGIGRFDRIAAHVYPGLRQRPPYVLAIPTAADSSAVVPLVAALGASKVAFGEFNMSASSLATLSAEASIHGMRQMYRDMDALGIQRATVWSWNTNLAMRDPITGAYNPAWGVLASNSGRISLAMFAQTRSQTPRNAVHRDTIRPDRRAV